MKTATMQQDTYNSIEDYEENCYIFSPSIQRRKTLSGKPYFVRRYFKGGTDFEQTMEEIAVKNITTKAR